MAFENASVIISGGSKGIGLSMARVFARNTQRRIVLIARSYEELKKAKKELLELGARGVEILAVDLTDTSSLETMDFQSLNPGILINNAGSFLFKKLEETTPEEFSRQFNSNVLCAFNLTQKVLPALKKQERALIANICSRASSIGYANSGAYAMSKHATLGYTRSLRKELMNSQIAVSAIILGQTWSTSWYESDVNPDKLIDPEDVGKLIISMSELSPRSVVEELSLMPQKGEL